MKGLSPLAMSRWVKLVLPQH